MASAPEAQPPHRATETVAAIAVVVLGVALVFVWVLRLKLLPTLNVNWDEFYFLSKVHAAERGTLSGKLLTFHVHLFPWVPEIAANEVDQVLAIRVAMALAMAMGTVATIAIGRQLGGSWRAGLFAALAGASFSLVVQYGFQARFDPLVVSSFLVACALLLRKRRLTDVLAGAFFALALLVSIKAVFYAPTLFVVWLARLWSGPPAAALRGGSYFVAGVVGVGAPLYAWHLSGLAPPAPRATASVDGGGLAAIAAKVLAGLFSFPQKGVLLQSVRFDTVTWAAMAAGAMAAVLRLRARETRPTALVALSFAIPLSSLTFYRNSFPYFYVTIIPASVLLLAVLDAEIARRIGPRLASGVAVALGLLMVVGAGRFYWANNEDQVSHQRTIVGAVHKVFPKPVSYVDRCAMISSFPKSGPFMSTWALEEYRDRGVPLFHELLKEERPLFLIENVKGLNLGKPYAGRRAHALLPADFEILRDNFVPYWGPLWIAGKRRHVAPGGTAPVDVAIPGTYVLMAAAPVSVDGEVVQPGGVVDLSWGRHALAADVEVDVELRTAEARPPPAEPPPRQRIFTRFTYRTRPPRGAEARAAPPAPADDTEEE